jgi:protocatechuate 3,4-dioxygenase, alpha subunit
MAQPLGYLKESPSQTAGPYVHIGLTPNALGLTGVYPADLGASMLTPAVEGERIRIEGRVFDGTGAPIKDGVVEIWQADANGRFGVNAEGFTGWGRSATDLDTGRFRFDTIKPGAVAMSDGRMQAPHIDFWIAARGVNLGLHTRLYFPDEEVANAADPLLSRLEHQSRAATLIARREGAGLIFDIHLQGADETVFLDI